MASTVQNLQEECSCWEEVDGAELLPYMCSSLSVAVTEGMARMEMSLSWWSFHAGICSVRAVMDSSDILTGTDSHVGTLHGNTSTLSP